MAWCCLWCLECFKEKSNLTRHVKGKHQEASLKCEKCSFTANRIDDVRRHENGKQIEWKMKMGSWKWFRTEIEAGEEEDDIDGLDNLLLKQDDADLLLDEEPTAREEDLETALANIKAASSKLKGSVSTVSMQTAAVAKQHPRTAVRPAVVDDFIRNFYHVRT